MVTDFSDAVECDSHLSKISKCANGLAHKQIKCRLPLEANSFVHAPRSFPVRPGQIGKNIKDRLCVTLLDLLVYVGVR